MTLAAIVVAAVLILHDDAGPRVVDIIEGVADPVGACWAIVSENKIDGSCARIEAWRPEARIVARPTDLCDGPPCASLRPRARP